MNAHELIVEGPPVGWARARVNMRARRHYNDPTTERGEALVRLAWIEAGCPRLSDGAIALEVEAVLSRPRAHYRKSGDLSAAGLASPWPTRKPDVDNVLKLVADALNGAAWRDDAQVAYAQVVKRWANAGEPPHTRVVLRDLPDSGAIR